MAKFKTFAKITQPQIQGIIHRDNLYNSLDQARKHKIIWIHAPGGYGKTTFVSDYIHSRELKVIWYQIDKRDNDIASFFYYMGLAAQKAGVKTKLNNFLPEYILGLSTFTENFFRPIFNQKQNISTLILDDYHEVSENLNYYEIIYHAARELPPDGNIIIISRNRPSHFFARMMASDEMILLDNTIFRLSYEEFLAVYRLKSTKEFSSEQLQQIYERTHGWLAGIILFLRTGATGTIDNELSEESIFNYLGQEIFSKLDAKTKDLLLRTAFLPRVSGEMAAVLTGNKKAEAILSDLSNDNYFTTKYKESSSNIYQYHPLLHNFLSLKAEETLTDNELYNTKLTSAHLLEQTGQIEAAAELWLKLKEWQNVIRLIKERTQIFIEQGRFKIIEDWLTKLPQYLFMNDPWLNYWAGVCKLSYNPIQSREYLEKAYNLFKAENNVNGLFVTISAIFNSYTLVWDDFTPLYKWFDESVTEKYAGLESKEAECSFTLGMLEALLYTITYDPKMSIWADRLTRLMDTSQNPDYKIRCCNVLTLYHIFMAEGDKASQILNNAKNIINSPNVSPLTQLSFYFVEAYYSWIVADFDRCGMAAEKGLRLAEETGIHILSSRLHGQLVYKYLFTGNIEKAASYLDIVTKNTNPSIVIDISNNHFLSAYFLYSQGDYKKALQEAKSGLGKILHLGFNLAIMAFHLRVAYASPLAGESLDKSLYHLNEVMKATHGVSNTWVELACRLNKALILLRHQESEHKEEGLTELAKGMRISINGNILGLEGWRREDIAFICSQAIENNIEPEHALEILRRFDLNTKEQNKKVALGIKIQTLGDFAIIQNEKKLEFGRKIPQKPLEMLKALIAMGAVNISAEKIIDSLWPEIEGDMGNKVFSTTLQRLRKILGDNDTIQYKKGGLSINTEKVWVDTLAIEELLSKPEKIIRNNTPEMLQSIYKGHFLQNENEKPAYIPLREKLKVKFILYIEKTGRNYEEINMPEKKIELYHYAIDTDPTIEVFYRNLIMAYKDKGYVNEALSIYDRCEKTLMATIQAEPSPLTKSLYESIVANKQN